MPLLTRIRKQWDRCLSSLLIRSSLGVGFGIVFSVLLFKRRAWPAWAGLGFGAGRAWEECDNVRFQKQDDEATRLAQPLDGILIMGNSHSKRRQHPRAMDFAF